MSEKQGAPKITEIAKILFDGDKLKNFLDFNEFLKENKMSKASTAKTASRWQVKSKNRRLCHLIASKDYWAITFYKDKEILEKSEKYLSDELKTFILENIVTIPGCSNKEGVPCKGIDNVVIFGKKFDKICGCHTLNLHNPDGKILEYAKQIVLINKMTASDLVTSKSQ